MFAVYNLLSQMIVCVLHDVSTFKADPGGLVHLYEPGC